MPPMSTSPIDRHGIEPGDLCEVISLVFRDEVHTDFAFYRFTEGNDLLFYRGDGTNYFRVASHRLRSIRKVTSAYVASQRYDGQVVTVFKYGSHYQARIVKVGRTRVTVVFTTRAGKSKTATVPAYAVKAL